MLSLIFSFIVLRAICFCLLALAAYYCLKGKVKGVIIIGMIFTLIMTLTTTAQRWPTLVLCIFISIIATVLTVYIKKVGIGLNSSQKVLEE